MAVCQVCGREGCIALMRVCCIAGRSASRPVCGKYRITDSCFFALQRRNAALAVKYQSKLCISRSFAVSLRERFFLLKKKRIASYQCSTIRLNFLFPIGRSSPLWILYVCNLEICKFFWINTLEEWEEDCSENGSSLELADFIRCSYIPLYPLRNERMMGIDKKVRINDILNLSHTYFYSYIRAYAHSKTECHFLAFHWHLMALQHIGKHC